MSDPMQSPLEGWRKPIKIGIFMGVLSLVAVTVVVAIWARSESNEPAADSSNESCAIIGNGNSCIIEKEADTVAAQSASDQQLKESLARRSHAKPVLPGPWPFMVYATVIGGVELGLKVKATPTMEGQQVGTVASRSLVWAECALTNNFNPEKGSDVDVGPRWLRIRWPTNEPGRNFQESSPTALFQQYVYAGYTLPFEHNGQIPTCS